jgi:threonine dehydrogenase-like Zn-dependent dehydrogenase
LRGAWRRSLGQFGWAIQAADIVSERGDAGADRIKELTDGIGADSVLKCVGTKEAMTQVIQGARPGALIGYAVVPRGVELDGQW